jgi:hypothetical protein
MKLKPQWLTSTNAIALIAIIISALSLGATVLVANTQIEQGQRIQALQSLSNNFTATMKPYVTEDVRLSVNRTNIYPTFHVLLHVMIITAHAGYLTITQTDFELANNSLQDVFNNTQSSVILSGGYSAPVNPGSYDLAFDLTFESWVYANYQWVESHPQQGIGGYLGWVDLQLSFYDGALHSTISQPFRFYVDINYMAYS